MKSHSYRDRIAVGGVWPGFDDRDMVLAGPEILQRDFPRHSEVLGDLVMAQVSQP